MARKETMPQPEPIRSKCRVEFYLPLELNPLNPQADKDNTVAAVTTLLMQALASCGHAPGNLLFEFEDEADTTANEKIELEFECFNCGTIMVNGRCPHCAGQGMMNEDPT